MPAEELELSAGTSDGVEGFVGVSPVEAVADPVELVEKPVDWARPGSSSVLVSPHATTEERSRW